MINHKANLSIQERTEEFARRVIKAYGELNKRHFDDGVKVFSKQFLRRKRNLSNELAVIINEIELIINELPARV